MLALTAAAPQARPVTEIEGLVRSFYDELWNQWDDVAVEQVLADGFVFRGSLGDRVEGPDGWRRYRDLIRTGATDFHNDVVDLVVSGERAAARLRYTGTHTGRLLGHAPTGRRFGYDGAAFFTAEHGRLVEAWVLGDRLAVIEQLQ